MDRKTVIKLIVGVMAVLLVCHIIQVSYYYYDKAMKAKNHKEIVSFVDEQITYVEGHMDEQLVMIEEWLNNRHIEDVDRGRLYERMSLIYKNRGDNANYYRAIGYALYYLDKGDDVSFMVNIYLDQVCFYITNFNFELATEELEKAKEICAFHEIESLQVRSYAYRLQAIIDEHYGRIGEAEKNLITSKEIVNQSDTGIFEDAYRAMIDTNLAKVYIDQKKFDDAQKILDEYADSVLFTQDIYRDVLVRDFIIPYYEAKCILTARGKNSEIIEPVIDQYIVYCDEYGFEKNKINTLLGLMKNYPSDNPEKNQEIYDIINQSYKSAMDKESRYATTLVQGQIDSSIDAMRNDQQAKADSWSRLQAMIMYFMFLLLVLVVSFVIVRNAQKDGLTKLRNRKAFNRSIAKMQHSQEEYGVIMMDIDDFKYVNDTYGHQKGDEVLVALGEILTGVENRTVVPFRYGGEEFAVIISKSSISAINIIAEQVRGSFERHTWDFGEVITVSLGASVGGGYKDVVKQADDNLYKSKQCGKNRITFSK